MRWKCVAAILALCLSAATSLRAGEPKTPPAQKVLEAAAKALATRVARRAAAEIRARP